MTEIIKQVKQQIGTETGEVTTNINIANIISIKINRNTIIIITIINNKYSITIEIKNAGIAGEKQHPLTKITINIGKQHIAVIINPLIVAKITIGIRDPTAP